MTGTTPGFGSELPPCIWEWQNMLKRNYILHPFNIYMPINLSTLSRYYLECFKSAVYTCGKKMKCVTELLIYGHSKSEDELYAAITLIGTIIVVCHHIPQMCLSFWSWNILVFTCNFLQAIKPHKTDIAHYFQMQN